MGLWDGGGGSIAGSLIGGGLSMIGGHQANIANARQASIQMDFQKMMSDTAHQREVKDLRSAGLNPILSAGGGGASTPGGASPLIQSTTEGLASSAREIPLMLADLRQKNAQTDLVTAQAAQVRSQTGITDKESYRAGLIERGMRTGVDVLKSIPAKFGVSKKTFTPEGIKALGTDAIRFWDPRSGMIQRRLD